MLVMEWADDPWGGANAQAAEAPWLKCPCYGSSAEAAGLLWRNARATGQFGAELVHMPRSIVDSPAPRVRYDPGDATGMGSALLEAFEPRIVSMSAVMVDTSPFVGPGFALGRK